jgi:hypothetical protein
MSAADDTNVCVVVERCESGAHIRAALSVLYSREED